ncbi:MAG: hypothetical protein P8P36_01830 [Akkermansiaceae bacterium]|nr:hypothetical protein [Akkermansiaceae bacterium]
MSQLSHAVSIHPYFKVNEGRLDDFKALMTRFVERTQTEDKCLYYDFSVSGNTVFCREAYIGAEGTIAHLDNVGDLIEEGLEFAELACIEVHGPAEELEKLKTPLAELPVKFYERVTGVS